MKPEHTLANVLQLAKTVESAVQKETLSNNFSRILENLIKLRYMVSTRSRDMAPRGPTLNVITIVTKAITDHVVMVINVVTVVLLIN